MSPEVIEAYCVKCGCARTIKNPVIRKMTSGRLYAQGNCPVCGMKVNKLVKKASLKQEQIERAAPIESTTPRRIEIIEEPEPEWIAFCRFCGKEQPVIGTVMATLWTGAKVVQGKCTGCGNQGNFMNAREMTDF